jgi:hypothetical protein
MTDLDIDMFSYFTDELIFTIGSITISKNTGAFDANGNYTETLTSNIVVTDKIWEAITSADLKRDGQGERSMNEQYSLTCRGRLAFSDGTTLAVDNIVTYDGDKFKVISEENWLRHGFIKYVCERFREDLND